MNNLPEYLCSDERRRPSAHLSLYVSMTLRGGRQKQYFSRMGGMRCSTAGLPLSPASSQGVQFLERRSHNSLSSAHNMGSVFSVLSCAAAAPLTQPALHCGPVKVHL